MKLDRRKDAHPKIDKLLKNYCNGPSVGRRFNGLKVTLLTLTLILLRNGLTAMLSHLSSATAFL